MATNDLTPKLAPFLDTHLLLPILNFVEETKSRPRADVLQAKIELLSKTSMIDYAADVRKELGSASLAPDEISASKAAVVEKLKLAEARATRLMAIVNDDEKMKELRDRNSFNFGFLSDRFQITGEEVDSLLPLGKLQYECGKYDVAAKILSAYRELVANDSQKLLGALWGLLASNILMSSWNDASRDLTALRELAEEIRLFPTAEKQLNVRTWILHWSLFVHFGVPQGLPSFLDLVFGNDRYIRVVQTKAPWLLRYLAIAAIITKQRIKDVVKAIDQEAYQFSDPIVDFVRALHLRFDFKAAQALLPVCDQVLAADYFAGSSSDDAVPLVRTEFMRCARLSIVEAFCRVHSTLDIAKVAEMLNQTTDEAERFLVNLITENRLDAKIDGTRGTVSIAPQIPTVYQQLIEKTKSLNLRASVLAGSIERAKAHQSRHSGKD